MKKKLKSISKDLKTMPLNNKTNNHKYTGVGLDIGNYSIKAAGIKKQPLAKKGTLSFAIEYLPENATPEQKCESIRKVLEKAGINEKKVNISICGPNVITRYIRLPFMRSYELQDAIELEWDKYISLKKDEVVWDYTVLNISKDAKAKFAQVLLVAVKKDIIEARIGLLKAAGLEPKAINIDSLALASVFNFVNPAKAKQPVLILNIGEYFTNEVIIKNNICWFSRDINIGGHDITSIIADRLHLKLAEAENLKCGLGEARKEEVYKLIQPVLDNLINEVKLSVEYLMKELAEDVRLIYIFGGSARLFNLDNYLSHALGIPIRKWSLAEAFSLSPKITPEAIKKNSPDLAVAVGLALTKKDAF